MEFLSITKQNTKTAKNIILAVFCWLAISLVVGVFAGLLGAGLYNLVHIANGLRNKYEFLLYFLPLFGVFIILIYKFLGVKGQDTNTVFKATKGKDGLSFKLVPAIFISTVLTHLAGGSAGKEGAALQIGGGISKGVAKLFKLNKNAEKILIISGMGAVFSAAFGTPFTAAVFAVSVISVGKIYFSAVFPAFIASFSSYFIASLFNVRPFFKSYFNLSSFGILDNLKVVFIMATVVIVGRLFIYSVKLTKKYSQKLIKNDYNRILLGGVLIVALAILFGSDYLGASFELLSNVAIYEIVNKEAFILKILFTAITLGFGFKGGEIVPTLIVGATFGAALAGELSVSVAVSASLSMIPIFCTVTKAPLASIILGIELFGFSHMPYYIIGVILAMLLSGKQSLYSSQEYLLFNKKDKNKKTA